MEKLLVGKSLEDQLDTVIKELAPKGNISYIVLQFDDEEESTIIASKGENTIHSSASLIKVLIMEYVFHLARTNQLDLNDTVPLSRTPRVEGGGALQELVVKHSFSYLELCRLMIVLSDNIATNLLITVLGMENINARAEQLGVEEIELNRMMMDFEALAEGRDNRMTAMALARLYKHIFECRDRDSFGREMWNILGRQQFRDILPFYWGEDVRFHHKTGSLDRVEHDGGILETFRGHFCFILLMSDTDNDRGKELGSRVGRIMKEFVEEALP